MTTQEYIDEAVRLLGGVANDKTAPLTDADYISIAQVYATLAVAAGVQDLWV